jgi:hypothetical protein
VSRGRGGAQPGAGRPPGSVKVEGKTWEEKRTREKELLSELRAEYRGIHAPGAPKDGPVARRHFCVMNGPKMSPPQGHIGPRLKKKDGTESVRHQCQYKDKEATLSRSIVFGG